MITHTAEVVFSDDLIQDIINGMHDWFGINVTEDHIKTMIESDPTWAVDVMRSGYDTVSRESSIDLFCRYVLKIMPYKWPLGSDKQSYCDMFYDGFNRETEKLGIKVK